MSRITNRRWVDLGVRDRVLGGAVRQRHRLQRHAAVSPVRADDERRRRDRRRRAAGHGHRRSSPSTFWEEVRRYGVTVASYTWTLLHDLVEAPPQPGERHHPVRLFIGSGMPQRAVAAGPAALRPGAGARVLRLHRDRRDPRQRPRRQAGRDGPPAARAAPRSGSPPTTSTRGQLVLGADGFVRECGTDEVGMLLARARARDGTATIALRGVFARDDAWLATGDLFRRDADGDYWRLDSVRELDPRPPAGPVFTAPIRDALGDSAGGRPGRRLRRAPARRGEHELARGRGDAARRARARRRDRCRRRLRVAARASSARRSCTCVDAIPVTTWYRPMTGSAARGRDPRAAGGKQAWYLDRGGKTYGR